MNSFTYAKTETERQNEKMQELDSIFCLFQQPNIAT